MKVTCPHCSVSYTIDDRRVPANGVNVRCPKCRNAFPVRKEASGDAGGGAVPLPAPAAAAAPAGPPPVGAAVPLPAPPVLVPPPPPAPSRSTAAIPLPAPSTPPVPDPFPFGPPGGAAARFPGPSPFRAAEPPPFGGPASPQAFDVTLPDLATPDPLPVPPDPAPDLGFGEVDVAGEPPPPAPFPAAPPMPDPFAEPAVPAPPRAAAPPPASAAPPPASDDLEMLFGEGADTKPKRAPAAGGKFKVRRRSGKIFGPFESDQIVQMLEKGELLGNEDASNEGEESWTALASVPAFGDAIRKLAAEPAPGPAVPAAPFGDRMAVGGKIVEGGGVEEGRIWDLLRKLLVPVAVLLLAGGIGVGAGFTRFGFFFVRAFRGVDTAKLVAQLGDARTALQRAEYAADRAALDAATRAVAADPDSADAAALYANIVAVLELRHGAPAPALEQARRAADRLDEEEQGKIPALAARLAVSLATTPGAGTGAQETALEQAAGRAAPDADVLALLAYSALARGDAARAVTVFGKLDALKPGTPRGALGTGLALAAKRDAAGAKAAFEKVLAAAPGHLRARLELATLAEAAGDLAEAETQLAPILVDGADAKLAPAERARALALRGVLLGRTSEHAAEADKVLEQALAADPKLVEPRLALARLRLRRADAVGAVAALEPVSGQAAGMPALAAVRIRALAAAGRALDASSLATAALQKAPGDPLLLLARASALEASGKAGEAAALFRDAAARDPGAYEPRLALGRIALASGDLASARVELAAAVEKAPREPAGHALLGELAAAEGDAAGAEKEYAGALALDREYAPAELGLAKLAVARGDRTDARARLERALALDVRSADGRLLYGNLLWQAKELPAAEVAYQAAVDLQPRNALALTRLGAVKLERGEDLPGAVQRLTAGVAEDEQLAEARLWLGRALLKRGETPAAVSSLRRAVQLEPRSAENHVGLAIGLERSGALQEAVDEYRGAMAADPKLTEAPERLGALFMSNNRFEDAAGAYERAIAASPKTAKYRIALGDARAKLGANEEAIRIYREALKIDGNAVQVHYRLARAVHDSQGAKAALPLYERAAKEEKENPMPHYFLGYLYKEKGQKARAADEFKRFLKMKPEADEKKDIEAEVEDLTGGK